MRLAYVYDAVYPWVKGGVERRVWELATRLADRHEVHLYGMKYWEGPDEIEREGVTLHGVCGPRDLYVDGKRSIRQAVYFGGKVLRPLLREEFDVVDCQEFPYFPILTSKLHELLGRSSLVVTWHEHWGDYWSDYLGPAGFFGRTVERLSLRLSNDVIAISDRVRGDLESAGARNVRVVPNGVDLGEIGSYPASEESFDAIYVGRLAEHKNVDLLVGALRRLDTVGLPVSTCVVGDGPERGYLEDLAEELGVEALVEFKGFLDDYGEVIGLLKSSKVFVSPSTREGFGMSVLEASACGTPPVVVEHRDNAATELVRDGETGLVAGASAEDLAEKVSLLLGDPELLAGASRMASELAESYDWDEVAGEAEEVYEAVAAKEGYPGRQK